MDLAKANYLKQAEKGRDSQREFLSSAASAAESEIETGARRSRRQLLKSLGQLERSTVIDGRADIVRFYYDP